MLLPNLLTSKEDSTATAPSLYQILLQRNMICSRLIVTILFVPVLFICYQVHPVITLIETNLEIGTQVHSLTVAPRKCKYPSTLFTRDIQKPYRSGAPATLRNLLTAQILTILDNVLDNDTPTHAIREDIPNIVPPIPASPCRNSTTLRLLGYCIEDVKDEVLFGTYIGAGLVVVPALFLFFWTSTRWVRALRLKNEAMLQHQPEEESVIWAGSDLQKRRKWFIPKQNWANLAGIGEESARGYRIKAKKARGRTKETQVFDPDIAKKIPWRRSEQRSRDMAQCYGKGKMQDIRVETTPSSSSLYILEPGRFVWNGSSGSRCPRAESENPRDGIARAVSTGTENPADQEVISQRKWSGIG